MIFYSFYINIKAYINIFPFKERLYNISGLHVLLFNSLKNNSVLFSFSIFIV